MNSCFGFSRRSPGVLVAAAEIFILLGLVVMVNLGFTGHDDWKLLEIKPRDESSLVQLLATDEGERYANRFSTLLSLMGYE